MFPCPMKRFALVAAVSPLAACGAFSGDLPRATTPDEPFAFAGGVVRPPAPGPWQVNRYEGEVVLFVRGTEDAEHRIFATAAVLERPFEDLQSYRDYLDRPSEEGDLRCVAREFEVVEPEGQIGYVRGVLAFERGPVDGVASRLDNRSRGYLLDDGRQVILSVTQSYPVALEPLDLSAELRPFFESFAPSQGEPVAGRETR